MQDIESWDAAIQSRVHSRDIDDERRRVRFPVRLKHLPTSRNHALPSIFNLARPAGIGANQMRAAHKARRKTTSRETVESRTTSPDKNAIGRACPLDDTLGQSEENRASCLRNPNAMIKKTSDRDGGSADDTYSHTSPLLLRRRRRCCATKREKACPARIDSGGSTVR